MEECKTCKQDLQDIRKRAFREGQLDIIKKVESSIEETHYRVTLSKYELKKIKDSI